MKHIAVIGAGISGLAAAYLLSRRHRVTLVERDTRLGGHTHTVVVDGPSGPIALDTGFLVHNTHTYPHLVRLFAEIGVETQPSDMSFSVWCPTTGFAYSSRGLSGYFAQPRNLVRAGHHRLLRDIFRFHRDAPGVLARPDTRHWTVGDFLRDRRFGDEFAPRYLVPMTSAIWSASAESVDRFPIHTLLQFLLNHGLLAMRGQPIWRVVRGGSHTYIPRLTAPLTNHGEVITSAGLVSILRGERGVVLTFARRPGLQVDEVVLACHGDQVLPLLANPTDQEREVFSQFTTTANEAWLHTDSAALPREAAARASWNYRLSGGASSPPSVTYHLNRLQRIDSAIDYCVTLNPRWTIDPTSVLRRMEYRHPQVTRESVRAQARWREVSGALRTHYCGAYWGHGFHEDGLMSAMRVADALGVAW